jgi:putative flippase GtrA
MQRLTHFLFVGALATALQYFVYGGLLQLAGWPAVAASMVGYLAGSVLSYALNYYLTFRSRRSHASAVPRFYAMAAGAFALNAAVVAMLVDGMAFNPWVGQVIATVVCLVWNYAVSRNWVFSEAR